MSYAKRLLHVDLTTGKTEIEPLKDDMAKKYIGGIGFGGIGLGMRLFLDNSKPDTDSFSPKNSINDDDVDDGTTIAAAIPAYLYVDKNVHPFLMIDGYQNVTEQVHEILEMNRFDYMPKTADDIQNIWNSSTFWQFGKMLQNHISWEYKFERRVGLRETLKVLHKLPFWILLKRKKWLPSSDFTKPHLSDKDSDSAFKFQNLRRPPPSLQISIYAQRLTIIFSSVFGRKTGDPKKVIFPSKGGMKDCRNKLERSLERFCPVCTELHLNLQNRLKRLCVNSFACLKITLNSLEKVFLSLSKYYIASKKAISLTLSKIWYCYSSSSNADDRITISIHKMLSNNGKFI